MPAAEKEPEVWIANPVGGTDHPYVRAVMVATDDRSAAASNLGARCVLVAVVAIPNVLPRNQPLGGSDEVIWAGQAWSYRHFAVITVPAKRTVTNIRIDDVIVIRV